MTNTFYERFVRRWEQVTDLPPQTLGPLTPYYKMLTRRLKQWPWPMLVFGSLFIVAGLYFILGSGIVFLTTLIQRGF